MKASILIFMALSVALFVYGDEEINFPFTGEPSVTFLRVGDNQYPEAGAYLTLNKVGDLWELAVEDLKTNQETKNEKLKEDKALAILSAFSALYDHWHNAPSTDKLNKRYSIVVHRDSPNWTTQLSVKDSGSEELTKLLNLLEYTD